MSSTRLFAIVYDNINFTLRKASQRLDSLTQQLNATTSAVFSLPSRFSRAIHSAARFVPEDLLCGCFDFIFADSCSQFRPGFGIPGTKFERSGGRSGISGERDRVKRCSTSARSRGSWSRAGCSSTSDIGAPLRCFPSPRGRL